MGYFADAAHSTHITRSTRVWTRIGQLRPTVSRRERVSLNTAVNAHCPTQVHLHETNCVNAQSTKTLFEKLLTLRPKEGLLYVLCDNTLYYRNWELAGCLQGKPLVQVFLPPYSPNLKLMEWLWKFLRQKSINSCLYRTRRPFHQAVFGFFNPGSTSLGKTMHPHSTSIFISSSRRLR